jgi:2-iminobutanoate/2-iminopropanoate deaminase
VKKLLLLSISLALFFLATVGAQDKPALSSLPFSPAVRSGPFIFVSGHIGIDPASGEFAGDDIAAQTAQTLKNIDNLLKKNFKTGLSSVVKTTVFLQSMDDYTKMNEVYASYFPGHKPARSTVEVSRLALGSLIEIDAIAVAPMFTPVSP